VAFTSLRVEPTWMMIGQAAGTAAALAAKSGGTIQGVDIAELQRRLRNCGLTIDDPKTKQTKP